MAILDHGRIDGHEGIEVVEVDDALAVGARHRRVYLGNHPPRDSPIGSLPLVPVSQLT